MSIETPLSTLRVVGIGPLFRPVASGVAKQNITVMAFMLQVLLQHAQPPSGGRLGLSSSVANQITIKKLSTSA